jgi:hypothetical protein
MTNTINYQAPVTSKAPGQYQNKNIKTTDTTISGTQEQLNDKDMTVADTFTITQQTEVSETYSRSSITRQNTTGDGFDLLRGLVVELLREQGIDYKVANGTEEIDLSQLGQEEAQALIADDGYFGVGQTSDRIANFAIALAGGDPSRLTVIKESVEQGFDEAMNALGNWLPDISYQTHDAIMEKLDAWAQQGVA